MLASVHLSMQSVKNSGVKKHLKVPTMAAWTRTANNAKRESHVVSSFDF